MTLADGWTPDQGGAILIDTSVLLEATAPGRDLFRQARRVLEEWPLAGVRLCTCGQILREYLVVATRPLDVNGLGLSPAAATENVETLAGRMAFLAETERVSLRLRRLVARGVASGKHIHDLNIAAVAAVHGVPRIVTADCSGFSHDDLEIAILDLGRMLA